MANNNDYDQAIDRIATFFKGAAKLQEVVKDLGMDKPKTDSPPAGAEGPSRKWVLAQTLYETFCQHSSGMNPRWANLEPELRYTWARIAEVAIKEMA